MKKLLSVISLAISVSCFGQEVRVLDSLLKLPVENVNLICKSVGVSTNKNGFANISSFNKGDTILISHLSYNNKLILFSEINTVIFLSKKAKTLPEVVFLEVKAPILQVLGNQTTIAPTKITQSKSTSDLLSNKLGVSVQENQPGGGSLNYRGMEANRLLLTIDGIPLNNTIYRSGHLQSSATINPFFLEKISIVSGPASIAYGNGAMSGALLFYTKNPLFKKPSMQIQTQVESSTNAVFFNFISNYHVKKTAFISGFSIKSFGNLRAGNNRIHGYKNWGKEPFVINGREQLFTAYQQADFKHKTLHKISNYKRLLSNTQFSTSTDIYRFDKMNDTYEGKQKYDKWYYGPQNRFLQSMKYSMSKENFFFDNMNTVFAFQKVRESRHYQKNGESFLSNRFENINIYDFSFDFNKYFFSSKFTYGLGTRHQKIISTATLSDDNNTYYNSTRYPDGGSFVNDYFVYGQLNIPVSLKFDILIGGRINQHFLNAHFRHSTFPFSEINNENLSFIKSVLLDYKTDFKTSFSVSYYSGFRNPNLDDIGKVFSKNDRDVLIPNNSLNPEYSDNLELAIKYENKRVLLQMQLFNTQISNAINREYGALNEADSMVYDGEMMRIQMNKNIESATINGIGLIGSLPFFSNLNLSLNCNYLIGKSSTNSPLAHIPPFNTRISIKYIYKQSEFEFYSIYNAWKKAEDYDFAGIDNLEEATADGTPRWITYNLKYQQKIGASLSFSIAIENITDLHYKSFASGLSSSGRNLILSLYSNF